MPSNHRLRCPFDSLTWLWGVSRQNTLWVPPVIIPAQQCPRHMYSPRLGRKATPLLGLARRSVWAGDCPEGRLPCTVRHRGEPGVRGWGGADPSTFRGWRPRSRVLVGWQRGKAVSRHLSLTTGGTWMALVLLPWQHRPSASSSVKRPSKTKAPFTCVHSASCRTEAKACPEDPRMGWGQWTVRSEGEVFPWRQFAFPLPQSLQRSPFHPLVELLMQRQDKLHGWAQLYSSHSWGCENVRKAFRISLILIFGMRRRPQSWRPRRGKCFKASPTRPTPRRFTPAIPRNDPVSCKMKWKSAARRYFCFKMMFFFVMEHCQSNHLWIAIKIWSRQHFCN